MLMARLIVEKGLPRNHAHLNFCQLFGMSDNITFNLANAGLTSPNTCLRRGQGHKCPLPDAQAKKNATVTGDMSRELSLIYKEIKRRGMA